MMHKAPNTCLHVHPHTPNTPPISHTHTHLHVSKQYANHTPSPPHPRRELLEAAQQATGLPGMYELSIGNADKGMLPEEEILRRVKQFQDAGLPVVVTQAPLFTQKAELFPDSVFAVGYDTAVRLVKPEYYGDDEAMLLQFAKLVYRGCSFVVGGRVDGEHGRFMTLRDVDIPENLQRGGLFRGLDEDVFRYGVLGGGVIGCVYGVCIGCVYMWWCGGICTHQTTVITRTARTCRQQSFVTRGFLTRDLAICKSIH